MELRAEHLEVRYPEGLALSEVQLVLPEGSRLFVGGLAGSGKTTLLKVLAGLVRPTRGRVTWDGEDVSKLRTSEKRARQARIAMVFQTDALFDSLTVLQNVMLPLVRRGIPDGPARARAEEILAEVGLASALEVKPEFLSGGMRKRAGLARAMAPRPQILLCDDPFAGLDPKTAAQVCALVEKEAQGRTLVISAPEPPPELPLSRWLWLERGRVLHDGGPVPELLDREPAAAAP